MALTLCHKKVKALIDKSTGLDTYPVYIPNSATSPSACYSMTNLSRDPQSSIGKTSISYAGFSVFIASHDNVEAHQMTQTLIDDLDMYSGDGIMQIKVESVSDEYEPSKDLFLKSIVLSIKFKE